MSEHQFLSRFGDAAHCLRLLERSQRELLSLLEGLTDPQLHARSAPEVWSPAEVIEHTAKTEDSFARVIRRLRRAAKGENLPAVPVPAGQLSAQGKPVAPEILQPKGMNRAELEAALHNTRAFLLKEVRESGDLINHPATFTHMFFGEVNALGWLQCAVFHQRHHLDQIRERLGGA
ncbi:MAG: DinB family protein [Meiothermus sp.]|nr:DinB family protein [Meiothermus sp.]